MNKYLFKATVNGQHHLQEAYGNNLDHAREEAGWMLAKRLNVSVSDISKFMGVGERKLSVFNFTIRIHKAKYSKSEWYNYIVPRRLTLVINPPIYKWMFWVISARKRS